MYPGHVIKPVDNWTYGVIDDVIMSTNMSKFWTAVTSLIFELERWSKAQNVGHQNGYLDNIPNFRDTYGEKVRLHLKFSSLLKISQLSL